MGLDDAAVARALWHRRRALEAVLEDDRESKPVKAEALRELEEVRHAACYPSNRFCGPIQGEMREVLLGKLVMVLSRATPEELAAIYRFATGEPLESAECGVRRLKWD